MRQVYMGWTHLFIWENLHSYLANNRPVAGMAPVFFNLTLIAHIDEALLCLCKLYDKTSRSYKLDSLIKDARKAAKSALHRQQLGEIQREWQDWSEVRDETVQRLSMYRNSVLVHLDKETVRQDAQISDEDALTLEMATILYKEARKLINAITYLFFQERTVTEVPSRDDFIHLLNYAKRGKLNI